MQRPSHNQPILHTAKVAANVLRRRIERKIEDYLEISLYLEEEKELGMQLGC